MRGSSHKEKINISDLCVIYIMHSKKIYYVIMNLDPKIKMLMMDNEICSNFYYMSDNTIFYQVEENKK